MPIEMEGLGAPGQTRRKLLQTHNAQGSPQPRPNAGPDPMDLFAGGQQQQRPSVVRLEGPPHVSAAPVASLDCSSVENPPIAELCRP